MDTKIYFVPIVDISWINLGALNPRKKYIAEPPPLDLCHEEAEGIVDLMQELYDGTFAFTVYTGEYCRDGFTDDPFIDTWKRAIRQGGEILVHPHEELIRDGSRNSNKEHMYQVIKRQYDRFKQVGITPTGYRGGLYAYGNFLTSLLEELNLCIDFSSAPGINNPDREAVWTDIPFTAFYLCKEDKLHVNCDDQKSDVLEVPIGANGLGTNNENYLYTDYDLASLESIKAIWDSLLRRVENDGKPFMIHTLFHTFSMSNSNMTDRYRKFTEYILENGGKAVTPTEMKSIYDSMHVQK